MPDSRLLGARHHIRQTLLALRTACMLLQVRPYHGPGMDAAPCSILDLGVIKEGGQTWCHRTLRAG